MSGVREYAFRALRRDGVAEDGVLVAPTRDAAVASLAARGVFATSLEEVTLRDLDRRVRVSIDDLALGLRSLATLLEAGVSASRALGLLVDLAPTSWVVPLADVRRQVGEGGRLSNALARSGLGLPEDVIGLIEAGEAGSGLGRSIQRAAELLERRAATRAAVRNALAYPTLLAVAGSASVALLVGVVLPRFAGLLAEYGQQLPVSTRLVLALGAVAKVTLIPLLLALGVGAVWVRHRMHDVAWQRALHRWLATLPAIGAIRRANATAQACSALAALLESGVPLADALPFASRASGDRAMEQAMMSARDGIAKGERLSVALTTAGGMTPVAVRLVRVGEETGELAAMLAHAGRIEAGSALQRVQRITRAIEPLMVLGFAAIVMLVATALLQAMYGLRPGV
jgi:general secretion pathway protein F